MVTEKLKEEVQKWCNQIGVYNESCGCKWCTTQIYEGIKAAFDEYLKKFER